MPEFDPKLKIGDVLTNEDLMRIFSVDNNQGIRPNNENNLIVVITDHTKGLYDDRWQGNVLHYVGSGKTGNQTLTRRNKTLANSKEDGRQVYLFEVFDSSNLAKYVYQGPVELSDKPYKEKQEDENGMIRDVWVFPLSLKQHIPTDEEIRSNAKMGQRHAESLANKKLTETAAKRRPPEESKRTTVSVTYVRDPYVTEYAKRRAHGKCQLCDNQAPFTDKDGKPYLECHHIIWLSKNGEDSIRNTVALCPNCHRKMHVVDDEKDRAALLERAKEDL